MTRPAWWKVAAAGLAGASLAVACGSRGSTSSSASLSASPAASTTVSAVCRDTAALRSSLDALTHVQVNANTAGQISDDIRNVQAKLTTFAVSAKGKWRAQTGALKASLSPLGTAVDTLVSQPSTASISGVLTALGGVNTAARTLLAVAGSHCPAPPPSPSASPSMPASRSPSASPSASG